MEGFGQYYPEAPEFEIGDITVAELKGAAAAAKASCGGPDGWRPAEFKLLGDGALEELAFLLNDIERTGKWPGVLMRARGGFSQN